MVSGALAHYSKGERDKDRVSQFLLSEHVPFRPLSLSLSLFSLAVQISVTRGIGDGRTGERESEHEDWKCRDTVDILFCEVKFSELQV